MVLNSYKLIENIINKLFEPDNKRIDNLIADLTNRNNAIQKIISYGFIHMGNTYISETNKTMFRINSINKENPTPIIAAQLMPEANLLLTDILNSQSDASRIRQILYKLINEACTIQEIRDALPECIVGLISQFVSMQREAEPAWSIQHDPRALRQYEALLPKIEMYAMSKLIY